MHCYPISITETEELDLVYDGLHQVYAPLLQSAETYNRQLVKLEEELRVYVASFAMLAGIEEEDLSEARRKEIHLIKVEIKRKKLVKRECEKKIQLIHALLKRMSDPRPTDQQMEEYFDRKKQTQISEMMKNIKADDFVQQEALAVHTGGPNGAH